MPMTSSIPVVNNGTVADTAGLESGSGRETGVAEAPSPENDSEF